jgi:hypothetical protein
VNALQLAVTVQLALYAVAIVAALVAMVRFVKLQRLASRHSSGSWWETSAARVAVTYAVKPLWITAAALLLGAFAPRLMGAMHS